jgi:hypothetical protein
MVGANFPNNFIASVLSFVPFTARQAEYQRLGEPFLTSIACLISLTVSVADCTSIPLE